MPAISSLGQVVTSGELRPKIGDSAWVAIDDTERRLDATSLAAVHGYPMELELEARATGAFVKQGDSSVVLPAIKSRIFTNEWRLVRVENEDEAYFATLRETGTTSGTLVATRKDVL